MKKKKKQKRIQLGSYYFEKQNQYIFFKKWDIDIGLTLVFTMVPE